MINYFRHLDIKVIVFAVIACYVIPWFIFGPIIIMTGSEDVTSNKIGMLVFALVTILAMLLPPFIAGYFTARYSKSLPQFLVLIVAFLGIGLHEAISKSSIGISMISGVMYFAMASLGAFVFLRGKTKNES